nr:MAG TPA: hypothetical protein [Caudoviricetes sp.]
MIKSPLLISLYTLLNSKSWHGIGFFPFTVSRILRHRFIMRSPPVSMSLAAQSPLY